VFERLLQKLEIERQALGGRVFDILGEVFSGVALRELLIQAIREGETPEAKARLHQKVEGALDHERLRDIMDRVALATEHMDSAKVFALKDDLEKAEARKLQPHFIRAFFSKDFPASAGRYTNVNPDVTKSLMFHRSSATETRLLDGAIRSPQVRTHLF